MPLSLSSLRTRSTALLLLALCSACSGDPGSSQVEPDAGDAEGLPEFAIPTTDIDESLDGSADNEAGPNGDCTTLGCPCTDDDECSSGYCVEVPGEGSSVCSELCDGECSLPDYECVVLVNSGGDAVQLCVPIDRLFCAPCETNADCARLGDQCLETLDGLYCAPDCSANRTCPAGGTCLEVNLGDELRYVCTPDDGVCGDCLDEDGDGFGIGADCTGLDCDDSSDDTFPSAIELCDGRDNNCDENIDEGFDLTQDPANCGACGVVCAGEQSTQTCENGVCEIIVCTDGFVNCDGVAENGCETPDDALNDCGGCPTLSTEPGTPCGSCDSGMWECDGADSVTCSGDRGDDARNACGGCGTVPNAPDTACGPCLDGAFACSGAEAVSCVGATPDSDGDTVCDNTDACPASDDRIDSDGDGVANGCDVCPGSNDRADADGDGVADGCDRCLGFDDRQDVDGDTIPNACDCDLAGCNTNATCTAANTGATCACNPGYTGDGRTCTPVQCPTLPTPANGAIIVTGTSVGSTATTTCNIGWTLQGTGVRSCEVTGAWSGTPATCFRPPGDLDCACDRTYSVGERVVLTGSNAPFGPTPALGTVGIVVAGNDNQGPTFELLVEFPGWGGGHNGRCTASDCGPCSERGSSRTYLPCSIVRPEGP